MFCLVMWPLIHLHRNLRSKNNQKKGKTAVRDPRNINCIINTKYDRNNMKNSEEIDAENTDGIEQDTKSLGDETRKALEKEKSEDSLVETEKQKKAKLLILGDDVARGIACLLSKHLNNMIIPSNYRSISLLPVICSVIKCIINSQISSNIWRLIDVFCHSFME